MGCLLDLRPSTASEHDEEECGTPESTLASLRRWPRAQAQAAAPPRHCCGRRLGLAGPNEMVHAFASVRVLLHTHEHLQASQSHVQQPAHSR